MTDERDEPIEESEAEAVDESQPKASRWRWIIVALIILTLLLGTYVYLHISANELMDRYAADLKQRMAAFEAGQSPTRPVLLGEPMDGNAADRYRLVEFALMPRQTWKNGSTPPPPIPDWFPFQIGDAEANDFDVSSRLAEIPPVIKGDEEKLSENARKFIKRYRPLVRAVREGLRCRTCDWEFPLDQFWSGPIPNLIAMRGVAQLMMWEAHEAPPEEAVETGLEIVAFGHDIARHPTLICHMISNAIRHIGYESLRSTLSRQDLKPKEVRRIITIFGRLKEPDPSRPFEFEAIGGEGVMAQLSGRLDQKTNPGQLGLDLPAIFVRSPLFMAWEWSGIRHYEGRMVDLVRLPLEEMDAAQNQFMQDVKDSWHIIPKIAIPNLLTARTNMVETECREDAMRLLAAAVFLEKQGEAEPLDREAILKVLEEESLPPDPFVPDATLQVWEEGGDWVAGSKTVAPDKRRQVRIPVPRGAK